ncbi:serine hydrolase domain-containing protein [Streptomyces syringium]|uniref:D-alanyl-D-alanine carboxypeptidase n=1 Tax=Streptomyces syringium TaxID=76729 RepID=A0ABS4XVN5_9ACTN|nr:serine hydrolase domain-containing protein [Streptomyces syringium]MBP2400574.1 D-alanyl-D-alanine carboxypeptidase [Streptomyces syringium]
MREQARQTFRSSGQQRSGPRRAASAVAAVAVGVMTMGALAPPAAFAAARPDPVQQGLNALVSNDGMPAALASVKDRDGRTRTYTAGVGDLATGSKVPDDGQVRIGSNTKTFTAVVVLQLVGEGKIGLDEPVDTYLPGLVRGKGIDGSRITVRHLLQHTSGLPNYVTYLGEDIRRYEPRDLLDIALQHEAVAEPGKKWEYSNTNYVLAGLIIEKVTRHSLVEEMDHRIIKRLGLRHTYFPAPGDVTIREPHPKGYYQDAAGAPLRDATELDPSWGWAAGQMISTNSDLNRFFTALLTGDLLAPAQLAQMRTTVPAGFPFRSGAEYGLGLVSTPLSCGGVYWGHGGSTTGYETRGGVTLDRHADRSRATKSRAVNVAVTIQPTDKTAMKRVESLVDTALCR